METVALALPAIDVSPASLPNVAKSPDGWSSLGCSCMLVFTPPDRPLLLVSTLYKRGAKLREPKESREIFVPAVAGCGVVARGLGFVTGASEG